MYYEFLLLFLRAIGAVSEEAVTRTTIAAIEVNSGVGGVGDVFSEGLVCGSSVAV